VFLNYVNAPMVSSRGKYVGGRGASGISVSIYSEVFVLWHEERESFN
jgi:hypothetical protein